MIIIYDDMCSLQRCGNIERQTVAYYKTLDELYVAEQVDTIILARDWDNIIEFDCATGNDYGFAIKAGNENNNGDLKWAN